MKQIEKVKEALKNAKDVIGEGNSDVEYGAKKALDYALNIINIYFPEGEQSDGK